MQENLKEIYPMIIDPRKRIGCVLMADLNGSTILQHNYSRAFGIYQRWLPEYLDQKRPRDCKCGIVAAASGDTTKVIMEEQCDLWEHFNALNSGMGAFIAENQNAEELSESEVKTRFVNSGYDVGCVGVGQIREAQLGQEDTNTGLAFNYACGALTSQKRAAKKLSFTYGAFIYVTSVLPAVDFVLNVSMALYARKQTLGISKQDSAKMLEYWRDVIQAMVDQLREIDNWQFLENKLALYNASKGTKLTEHCSEMLGLVEKIVCIIKNNASEEFGICLNQIVREMRVCSQEWQEKVIFSTWCPEFDPIHNPDEDSRKFRAQIEEQAKREGAIWTRQEVIENRQELLIQLFINA